MRAERGLGAGAVDRTSKALEFPPGSGRVAVYSPGEQEFLMFFINEALGCPPGHPARAERERECRILHELKVEFGLDLLADEVGPR